ncbi:hypothetical protein LCE44_00195 [Vibrio harveyi]|uniref:hypothetical protein n=1 Tax=Vibrio harveyi TaxID=669 RepID=UPI003BF69DAF
MDFSLKKSAYVFSAVLIFGTVMSIYNMFANDYYDLEWLRALLILKDILLASSVIAICTFKNNDLINQKINWLSWKHIIMVSGAVIVTVMIPYTNLMFDNIAYLSTDASAKSQNGQLFYIKYAFENLPYAFIYLFAGGMFLFHRKKVVSLFFGSLCLTLIFIKTGLTAMSYIEQVLTEEYIAHHWMIYRVLFDLGGVAFFYSWVKTNNELIITIPASKVAD